jgi:hypothetical protein
MNAQLLSGTVVLSSHEVAYSLLVGNMDLRSYSGAHDLATHEIILAMQSRGYKWLCLGGGRSSAHNDSLLQFKAKFSAGCLKPLPLALVTHDSQALHELCTKAEQEPFINKDLQPSGEAITRFMRYRFSPSFANRDALA